MKDIINEFGELQLALPFDTDSTNIQNIEDSEYIADGTCRTCGRFETECECCEVVDITEACPDCGVVGLHMCPRWL